MSLSVSKTRSQTEPTRGIDMNGENFDVKAFMAQQLDLLERVEKLEAEIAKLRTPSEYTYSTDGKGIPYYSKVAVSAS